MPCLASRHTHRVDGGEGGGQDACAESCATHTVFGRGDVGEDAVKRDFLEEDRLRVSLDVHGDEVEDGGEPGGIIACAHNTREGRFAVLPERGRQRGPGWGRARGLVGWGERGGAAEARTGECAGRRVALALVRGPAGESNMRVGDAGQTCKIEPPPPHF